jgi:predicted nucleic acid-binding protein
MSFLPVYLDSSALIKLILPEKESVSLEHALLDWSDWVSSELAAVECRRTLRRIGAPPGAIRRADDVLQTTTLIRVDTALMRLADHVGPRMIRSLDAIHLAAALSIGDYPEAFITYDDRLAAAARTLKLNVLQPGR